MASTTAFVDFSASTPQHTSTSLDDSDLDPAAFLKSVRELSEKREKEDAERYRKLEQEIEQGRLERAKRREDRARSISPVKSHGPSANASLKSPTRGVDDARSNPPSPAPSSSTNMEYSIVHSDDIPDFQGFGSASTQRTSGVAKHTPPTRSDSSASTAAPTATSLARSGTLSWQQRPKSRVGGSRPQSVVSVGSTSGRDAPQEETTPSRDSIAASLGSRDPTWFRQTAERGLGNAALRKSKDEDPSANTMASARRGLPGLSRESSVNLSRGGSPAPREEPLFEATSRGGALRTNSGMSSNCSPIRSSLINKPDLKALIAADADQENASPAFARATPNTIDRDPANLDRPLVSSTHARLGSSTERPPSPTKGMGGFVQSAMLKRSDSVNKRWSAQPSTTIDRQNSIANLRGGGYGGLTTSHSMPRLERTPGSREASNEPLSRPTSSSSNLTQMTAGQSKEREDVFVKPIDPPQSRIATIVPTIAAASAERATSPPPSPSKRWSPTKSSWLESAITRPESPKPAAPRNSQPSWMTDIAKAKAQRASADSTPKLDEPARSRSVSPTKAAFGQSMLRRSDSRDLGPPRSSTPKGFREIKAEAATRASSEPNLIRQSEDRGRSTLASGNVESRTSTVAGQASAITTRAEQAEDSTREKDTMATQNKAMDEPTPDILKPSTKPPPVTTKVKPDTPPKPPTDFRSTLRTRPGPEIKQQDAPEFLSRFGNLRKTQTQNYVAPDLLKDNIIRGKSDLSKTDGPVKTARRDELKESLLAKKGQWQKDKEDGVVHVRKTSGPAPQTPLKPEALAKRERLGRSESIKQSPEKPKIATPEALARHRSLREKAPPETALPALQKHISEPTEIPVGSMPLLPKKQTSTPLPSIASSTTAQALDTSKLAARFNPDLAGILARGRPTTSVSSPTPSSESLAIPERSVLALTSPSEPSADAGQLQDMRKGRAKGPKRRRNGVQGVAADASQADSAPAAQGIDSPALVSTPESVGEAVSVAEKPKPRAPVGSAASIMRASLQERSGNTPIEPPATPLKGSSSMISDRPDEMVHGGSSNATSKPPLAAKSPLLVGVKPGTDKPATPVKSPYISSGTPMAIEKSNDVPHFTGFGATMPNSFSPAVRLIEDDKENVGQGSPSVKATASSWGRQSPARRQQPPTQIQLPSRKDEEAAMRSAGLLASSPIRPSSRDGLGIALGQIGSSQDSVAASTVPPKPAKPSRAVSGQLQEASPNQGSSRLAESQHSQTRQALLDTFESVPQSTSPLSIDTPAVVSSSAHQERVFRTVRKTVQTLSTDGVLKQVPSHEEYLFFDESAYVCTHAYTVADGPKRSEVFVWAGESTAASSVEQAQSMAKKLSKEAGNAFVSNVRQGFEPPGFLQAMGGILVTRRGSREGAPKQYMLCGRQHLGQIVFDEVDFGVTSLCSAFTYLISYPVTLQETRLYLWKGAASSTEEIGAARLAAMDLSETGEIIEVDNGAEFSSFLKIFGQGTTKTSIPEPSELWQQKSVAPSQFTTRLFRIQPGETKGSIFTNIFARRPSWHNRSPARTRDEAFRAEAREISPFTQADMDADCIYVLDAFAQIYVLVGPVFASQPDNHSPALFSQAVLFASEYAVLAASHEDRPAVPGALAVFSGVPDEVKMLFRHWDESNGLWGTAGLMAGSTTAGRTQTVRMAKLEDVIEVVCRSQ